MKRIAFLLLGLSLPTLAMAANGKENYLGFGVGVASQGGYSDSGYTFLFQMQQARNTAIGFAYQDSDKLTFTYKMYTGAYAKSVFFEGGILLNTFNDAVAPVVGVGSEIPLQEDMKISATAGAGFDANGVAFIGRVAIIFEI